MNKRRRRSNKPYRTRRTFFERFSLFLTLIIVSAFAIFAGYIVGQWATTDETTPLTIVDATEEDHPLVLSESTSDKENNAPSSATTIPPVTEATLPATGPVTPSETPAERQASPPQSEAPSRTPVTPRTQTPSDNASPPVSEATPQPSAASTPELYRVRVGAFKTRDEAESEMTAVKSADPPITDAFVTFDSGNSVFRVQVGSFRSLDGAKEMADHMKKQGFDAIVAQ